VINVDGGTDYRLRTLEQAELYHYPLGPAADASLRDSFERLAPEPGQHWQRIEVNGRYLTCRCLADDVAWFEFAELCGGPRSPNGLHRTGAGLSRGAAVRVPVHGAHHGRPEPALHQPGGRILRPQCETGYRRRRTCRSAVPWQRLAFEFQRTVSRLQEMQSHDYLASEHRP
jgi:cell division protein ZapE